MSRLVVRAFLTRYTTKQNWDKTTLELEFKAIRKIDDQRTSIFDTIVTQADLSPDNYKAARELLVSAKVVKFTFEVEDD